MMVFLFLYSVVELGNAAVVDNCPISADEREMRIKEFFRKDSAVCNHNENYHCIPLLDDTSFNGFYEGCLEDIVIDKDGCFDAADVSGKIYFNEIQTPCNISCCPMPGTKYKSSELYKYPACYQNVSSRSSYSCPVVSTPTTKILHQSTTAETTAETTLIDNTSPTGLFTGINSTAETTAETTLIDNTSPTGLFTGINSTVTPSPKNTGSISGVILAIIIIIVTVVILICCLLICCWRIEWCKNKRRNLQRHLCIDPLPTDTDEALQEKFLPTSQDVIELELLPASAPSQQPEQLPASVPSQQPEQLPASAPSQQPEQLPASAPSQQQGQLPASAPSQQPGQLPASVPNSPPAQEPSSAHYQQPGQLPASAPSPQPGQLPASVSNSPAAQEPSSAHYQQPGQLSASAPGQQPGQLPASTQIQLPGQIPATVPSSQPDLEQGLSSAIDKQGTLSIPDTQMQADSRADIDSETTIPNNTVVQETPEPDSRADIDSETTIPKNTIGQETPEPDDTFTHYVRMGQSCQLSRNLEGSSECQWYKNGIRVTEGIRNNGRVSLLTVTVSSFNTTYQSKVNDVTEHHVLIFDDGEAENENVNSSGPQDQTDSRADIDSETTIPKNTIGQETPEPDSRADIDSETTIPKNTIGQETPEPDSRADIDSETTIPKNTIGQETPEPGTSYMNREEIRTGEKAISPGIDERLVRIIEDKEKLLGTIETVVGNLQDMNEKALSKDEDIKESVRNITEKCCDALDKIRNNMRGIRNWTNNFTELLDKLYIKSQRKDNENIKFMSKQLEVVAQKCCSAFKECLKSLHDVCDYIKDKNNTSGFDKQNLGALISSLQSLYENWTTIFNIFSDTTQDVDTKLLYQAEYVKERAESNLCINESLLQVRSTADAFSEFADGFVTSYDEKIRKLVVDLTKPYWGYARRPQLEQRVDSIPRDNENDELEELLKNGEKR